MADSTNGHDLEQNELPPAADQTSAGTPPLPEPGMYVSAYVEGDSEQHRGVVVDVFPEMCAFWIRDEVTGARKLLIGGETSIKQLVR